MDKLCAKCKLYQSIENFNWKSKNTKYSSYCKECSREYIREHYLKNKSYYIAKAKRRDNILRQELYNYVINYFSTHPCVDCGESDFLVLEFDHKERTSKESNISSIIRRAKPIYKLIEEISKCDVRCANCHRRKTERENNSWKLKYVHP